MLCLAKAFFLGWVHSRQIKSFLCHFWLFNICASNINSIKIRMSFHFPMSCNTTWNIYGSKIPEVCCKDTYKILLVSFSWRNTQALEMCFWNAFMLNFICLAHNQMSLLLGDFGSSYKRGNMKSETHIQFGVGIWGFHTQLCSVTLSNLLTPSMVFVSASFGDAQMFHKDFSIYPNSP